MGITFPATAALLGDESGTEGSATGSLLAVNTTGAIVATFVLPFFVIPLIGSPATLALLAIVNARRRRAPVRERGPAGRRSGPPAWAMAAGVAIAVVVVVASCAARPSGNPTIQLIEAKRRRRSSRRPRTRSRAVEAGSSSYPPAVGQRDVDDADHRRHEAHAAAAADAPAGRGARPRHRVRDGHGVPDVARRPASKTDAVELVPSVPEMFHWFYERRRRGPRRTRAAR